MNKVTTAYIPPQLIHAALANVMAYMHGTEGYRKPGQPEISDFQLLDDRAGTGCYRLLFPEVNSAAARRIVGIGPKLVDITQEDA
jgi:hypothetical protein